MLPHLQAPLFQLAHFLAVLPGVAFFLQPSAFFPRLFHFLPQLRLIAHRSAVARAFLGLCRLGVNSLSLAWYIYITRTFIAPYRRKCAVCTGLYSSGGSFALLFLNTRVDNRFRLRYIRIVLCGRRLLCSLGLPVRVEPRSSGGTFSLYTSNIVNCINRSVFPNRNS